jgi:hypothetical protein
MFYFDIEMEGKILWDKTKLARAVRTEQSKRRNTSTYLAVRASANVEHFSYSYSRNRFLR